MFKTTFIHLLIHLSYKYLFCAYDMLGNKQGAGGTDTDNQRGLKEMVTQ